ncbi:hypothetical protein [Halocynthiibacter styelae]|uniref:Uncharacterized protein n=1 Tax=Halocynthiibacter styelae TaxID=2761955 RepID=A0A8J7ITB8_9RHOB|nr:hypothetical protein [Paenihalocynthiibacter styelae]MBI1495261.1 hypothetical protein [Paenihalocynthiibacter styelae]
MYDKFKNFIHQSETNIEEKHQNILEIHGLVASDGVAGGYAKLAKDEQQSANTWRLIAMGCYALIFIWVMIKGKLGFGIDSLTGINWPTIITTLSVTGVSFVAAQYASRQSRLHRVTEQRMRWFALEVKALDPFIASLTTDQQQKLKEELANRLFGQDRVAEEKPVRGMAPGTVKEIAEAVTDAVQTVGKS